MATNRHDLRIGQIEYQCTMIRQDGVYRAEYLCPTCQRLFTSLRQYATEREGAIRMKAVIYGEHHVPVHLIPDRGDTLPGSTNASELNDLKARNVRLPG